MARKMKTMDGNTAAAHAAYAFTEVAGIYPITPSSPMADYVDKWSAGGQKNIFGQQVKVSEMQSEAGAAGAVHGSLSAGALTTTFTASQGLLLMIPNMYKIAGELLPGVFHVSARALASHALSIFGDHSDVMACRQTGFAMLASTNPQESMDLAAVAHLAAIKGRVPFLHFFDGFRTSHEMQNIEIWDYADLAEMVDMDAVRAFRERALNPEHPVLHGTAQNPDIFFQAREASNPYYDAVPEIVEEYMAKVNAKIGTNYQLFNYYGAPDAEYVLIAMGSVNDAAEEVVDYLTAKGEKVGLVKVRLYRPFRADKLLAAIPATCKKIAVLDRTKEPGALGEPLYLDVQAAVATSGRNIQVVGGRYGLGSKDVTPGCIVAAYRNIQKGEPKDHFTVGIEDDVTHLSLPIDENPDVTAKGIVSCKFWGLGSDGTVGANKNSIKIIGGVKKYAQAYFEYDSKKSGGLTISHLRFGDVPIKSTYYVTKADFVACHNPAYMGTYEIVQDVKPGGSFLLNTHWTDEELSEHLPAAAKRHIAKNNIKFYTVDGYKAGREIGLGTRINGVLQAAFFKITNIVPLDRAVEEMKALIKYTYGRKGDDIVNMNYAAVDAGINMVHEVNVPAEWADAKDCCCCGAAEEKVYDRPEMKKFVEGILEPVSKHLGDRLPVSTFVDMADGTFPQGSAAYEKRGIAVEVPEWDPEKCIQCNQCSLVCPHAVIRPYLLDEAEAAAAPAGTKMADMKPKGAYKFAMGISVLDCVGCGLCAKCCPAKEKALVMKPLETQEAEQKKFDYLAKSVSYKETNFKPETVKGSQFKQPLLEFSGACPGCGETAYAKLITQLFGDRMMIANATGCSSIWGGSAPSTPYTVNKEGHGPAWANSLFEDNAEFGYGMFLAVKARREKLAGTVRALAEKCAEWPEMKAACEEWLAGMEEANLSKAAAEKLLALCKKCCDCGCEADALEKEVIENADLLVKKSIWIFGGDGWAYDIGFGGLDQVIASGDDVNIFVFDTEVYSNTGGQASKSSQIGQVAQFAASGKKVAKKNLCEIAMTYGYVYTAQIGLGANQAQAVKAIVEAESYHGPSLIVAYAPCINHGLKGGMSNSQAEIKAAVDAGYWHLFRYDPRLAEAGKNPFQLDSKAPTAAYKDFITKETRYSSLQKAFPNLAAELFDRAADTAAAKYERLKKRAEQ